MLWRRHCYISYSAVFQPGAFLIGIVFLFHYFISCVVELDKEVVTERLKNLPKSRIWEVLKQKFNLNLLIPQYNAGL